MARAQKGRHLSRKRAARERIVSRLESINTNAMVANTHFTASKGVITNRVISKKKAKKLARNRKYAHIRKFGPKKHGSKDDDTMEIDGGNHSSRGQRRHIEKEDPIRKALWLVVENEPKQPINPVGKGTTLGGPAF